jgi:hypothetical protein
MAFDFNFLFAFVNISILPVWVLLIFMPSREITRWITDTYIIQMILALMYLFLIFGTIGEGEGGFGSLQEIRKGFESDAILLAGWIHYIIFDSFVGTWMVRDAQKNNISHMRIIAPLVFTLFLGPIGLLLYLAYKRVAGKK